MELKRTFSSLLIGTDERLTKSKKNKWSELKSLVETLQSKDKSKIELDDLNRKRLSNTKKFNLMYFLLNDKDVLSSKSQDSIYIQIGTAYESPLSRSIIQVIDFLFVNSDKEPRVTYLSKDAFILNGFLTRLHRKTDVPNNRETINMLLEKT